MTELIQAAVLGVVQGLTEFLPVSSSGHLEIAKFVMGDTNVPKESLLMTVVLHFATAISTVVVFRKEVVEIMVGLFRFEKNDQLIFSLKILLSMIPAAIIGMTFELDTLFDKQLTLVGLMLIVTGVLLIMADRAKRTEHGVGFWDAVWIGIAQAIAILPGISRSGATISTSVLLGIDRARAARFSFLMVIPLIFGKMASLVLDNISEPEKFATDNVGPLLLGFTVAFVTGLVACSLMIRLVKASKLSYFSLYCFLMAMFAIGKGTGTF